MTNYSDLYRALDALDTAIWRCGRTSYEYGRSPSRTLECIKRARACDYAQERAKYALRTVRVEWAKAFRKSCALFAWEARYPDKYSAWVLGEEERRLYRDAYAWVQNIQDYAFEEGCYIHSHDFFENVKNEIPPEQWQKKTRY